MGGARSRLLAGLLLAALLVLFGLASRQGVGSLGSPSGLVTFRDPEPAGPTPTPSRTTTDREVGLHTLSAAPAWLHTVAIVVAVLAALVVVVLLARRLASARPPGPARMVDEVEETAELSVADQQQVQDSLAGLLARLRSGADLDEAVIACWLALEDVAARQGLTRHPAQTAHEFTVDVLASTRAPRDDLVTLADLYRSAMFSGLSPTADDRRRAIASLERLLAAMGERAVIRGGGGPHA